MTLAPSPREDWLTAVMERLRETFAQLGHPIPDAIGLAVGFPHRRVNTGAYLYDLDTNEPFSLDYDNRFNTRGVCERLDKNTAACRIVISPVADSSIDAAETLTHELIHAAVGVEHGHKGPFKELATAFGLEGPMRTTTPGPAFKELMAPIFETVGEYPPAEPRPILDRRNLPEAVEELAAAIRANLAAEDMIAVAKNAAGDAAVKVFHETTAEAKKALEAAKASYEAVAEPARRIRKDALEEARKSADGQVRDIRIETGFLLLAARAKVETDWHDWCQANVKRPNGTVPSRPDIHQMMELAKSADPEAARETEKRRAREGMRRTRERRKPSVTGDDVTDTSEPACEAIPPAHEPFRNFKEIILQWWTDADAADRLALGQWFDELRQSKAVAAE
jgi:hypothetical protein